MIDKNYIDLMHRELDGELSKSERETLQIFLNKNPEARQLFLELKQTVSVLEGIPPVTPPARLKTNILNAVRQKQQKSIPSKTIPLPTKNHPSFLKSKMRLALAFATGFLVAFILTALLFRQNSIQPLPTFGEVQGTIGLVSESEMLPITEFPINSQEVEGSLVWGRLNQFYGIKLKLNSALPGELDVKFPESKMVYLGNLSPAFPESKIQINRGEVKALLPGTVEVFFLFQPRVAGKIPVRVRFRSNGQILLEKTVETTP